MAHVKGRSNMFQVWLRIRFRPPPTTPEFLNKDFCLQPGLGWKFLRRRTWSRQTPLPLQFPRLSLPDSLLPPRIRWKITRRWGPGSNRDPDLPSRPKIFQKLLNKKKFLNENYFVIITKKLCIQLEKVTTNITELIFSRIFIL